MEGFPSLSEQSEDPDWLVERQGSLRKDWHVVYCLVLSQALNDGYLWRILSLPFVRELLM